MCAMSLYVYLLHERVGRDQEDQDYRLPVGQRLLLPDPVEHTPAQ